MNPFRGKTATIDEAVKALSESAAKAEEALKVARLNAEHADNLWAEAASQEGASDTALIYAAKCEADWQTAQRELAKREVVARVANERLEAARTEAGQRALKLELERKEADRAAALAVLGKRTKCAHRLQKLVAELEGAVVELVGHGADLAQATQALGLNLDLEGYALTRAGVQALLRLEMRRTPSGLLDWANTAWNLGKPEIPELAEQFERMDRSARAAIEATRG